MHIKFWTENVGEKYSTGDVDESSRQYWNGSWETIWKDIDSNYADREMGMMSCFEYGLELLASIMEGRKCQLYKQYSVHCNWLIIPSNIVHIAKYFVCSELNPVYLSRKYIYHYETYLGIIRYFVWTCMKSSSKYQSERN